MSVKQSSKKSLSHIYCRRKSNGPVQSEGKKVIVLYEYYHRHTRIKDVLDIPKQCYTDLHGLVTLFYNYLKKFHSFFIDVNNTITSKKIVSQLSYKQLFLGIHSHPKHKQAYLGILSHP